MSRHTKKVLRQVVEDLGDAMFIHPDGWWAPVDAIHHEDVDELTLEAIRSAAREREAALLEALAARGRAQTAPATEAARDVPRSSGDIVTPFMPDEEFEREVLKLLKEDPTLGDAALQPRIAPTAERLGYKPPGRGRIRGFLARRGE